MSDYRTPLGTFAEAERDMFAATNAIMVEYAKAQNEWIAALLASRGLTLGDCGRCVLVTQRSDYGGPVTLSDWWTTDTCHLEVDGIPLEPKFQWTIRYSASTFGLAAEPTP